MARVFLAEAGQCRPLDFYPRACARLHIFIPVFYCKLYTGEVIGLCFNKLAVYSPSTKLYTNCSPALSPQMSAVRRTLPGGMFRCSRFASSGRDGRWRFLGEGGRTGRAVFVCASLSQNQAGQGAETRRHLVRATRQVVRTAGHFASPRQYALAGIYLLWSFLGAFHAVSLGGYGESRTFEASGRLPVQHCRHVRNNCS